MLKTFQFRAVLNSIFFFNLRCGINFCHKSVVHFVVEMNFTLITLKLGTALSIKLILQLQYFKVLFLRMYC